MKQQKIICQLVFQRHWSKWFSVVNSYERWVINSLCQSQMTTCKVTIWWIRSINTKQNIHGSKFNVMYLFRQYKMQSTMNCISHVRQPVLNVRRNKLNEELKQNIQNKTEKQYRVVFWWDRQCLFMYYKISQLNSKNTLMKYVVLFAIFTTCCCFRLLSHAQLPF